MNRPAFQKGYPALSSTIGGDFGDSPAHDDESIARQFAHDFSPSERARYLGVVLAEVHDFMPHLDEHWEAVAKVANRRLYTQEQVRDWLLRIVIVWQEELTRLRRGDSGAA